MNFSLIIYTSNKYMYGKTSDQKLVALIFSIFTHYMLNLITIIQLYNESSIWENYPQEMMLKTVYFKARVYTFSPNHSKEDSFSLCTCSALWYDNSLVHDIGTRETASTGAWH